MSFRVLSYNIRYGGHGREAELAAVAAAAAPDLVVLQEATAPDVVERIAARLGMTASAARRGGSLAFLSRQAVVDYKWRKPRWSQHAYLEIVTGAGLPNVFGVHLSAVHSNWTERRRVLELRALLEDIRGEDRGFHLVTGDFNTLAPGEELDIDRLPARLRTVVWLTGKRIRWQTVKLILEAGYVDGYRLRDPDGRGFTFPTWDAHLRLDYAFLPTLHADRLVACEVVTHPDAQKASDHLPLLTEVS